MENTNSRKNQGPQPGGFSFIYLMLMMLTLVIWSIPGIRDSIGESANYIFYPLFGLNGKYPIITLILTGLLITVINMYARHYFIDWYGMAKVQYKSRQLSKLMREAIKKNDKAMMEKVRSFQQKLMMENVKIMNDQMKPTMIVFIFGIVIMVWIYYFIFSLPSIYRSIYLPWTYPSGMDLATGPSIFPVWVIVYMFFTGTVGYFISYIFKLYEFSLRLKNIERLERK
ncbi:MAG: DUF106 domain-containing protein [Thermoplasmata archaeon]